MFHSIQAVEVCPNFHEIYVSVYAPFPGLWEQIPHQNLDPQCLFISRMW